MFQRIWRQLVNGFSNYLLACRRRCIEGTRILVESVYREIQREAPQAAKAAERAPAQKVITPDLAFKMGMQALVKEWTDEKFDDNILIRDFHLPLPVIRELSRGLFRHYRFWLPPDILGAHTVKEIMEEICRTEDVFYTR